MKKSDVKFYVHVIKYRPGQCKFYIYDSDGYYWVPVADASGNVVRVVQSPTKVWLRMPDEKAMRSAAKELICKAKRKLTASSVESEYYLSEEEL